MLIQLRSKVLRNRQAVNDFTKLLRRNDPEAIRILESRRVRLYFSCNIIDFNLYCAVDPQLVYLEPLIKELESKSINNLELSFILIRDGNLELLGNSKLKLARLDFSVFEVSLTTVRKVINGSFELNILILGNCDIEAAIEAKKSGKFNVCWRSGRGSLVQF